MVVTPEAVLSYLSRYYDLDVSPIPSHARASRASAHAYKFASSIRSIACAAILT